MRIIWIGKYASNGYFNELLENGYTDVAAQKSQSNIIESLYSLGYKVDSFNAINVPSNYRKFFLREYRWCSSNNSNNLIVGFPNIKHLSHIFRSYNLKRAIKSSLHNVEKERTILLVYGLQSSLLSAAIAAKKKISNCSIYIIIPDLPMYMDFNMSKLKKKLKKLDSLLINKFLNSVEGFILYSKHMSDYFRIEESKYIVVEGSYSTSTRGCLMNQNQNEAKSIMYSGKLDFQYGIKELIDAFDFIEDGIELWLTGVGNATEYIVKKSKQNKNVRYFGFIKNKSDFEQLQKAATMFINLRLPSEPNSKYSFPSKIFEYMVSGKPTLSFRIGGIPEEYYKFLILIKDQSPMEIALSIYEVLRMSDKERNDFSDKAKNFILYHKNPIKQTSKIIEFINKIK